MLYRGHAVPDTGGWCGGQANQKAQEPSKKKTKIPYKTPANMSPSCPDSVSIQQTHVCLLDLFVKQQFAA